MTSFFCWHELRTPDVAAAKTFYAELLGWKFHEAPVPGAGTYTGIMIGERGIGGICEGQKGEPPHWISYVTVDDVQAAAERGARLGGKTMMPKTEIPTVGHFCVLQDPQGAFICPWKGFQPSKPDEGFAPGAWCWSELLTPDVEGSKRFYGELFGWTSAAVPIAGMGTYWLLKDGGVDRGGLMPKPPGAPGPAAWLNYALAPDLDGSAAKAAKLGAQTWVPPTDIPNVGRFSVHADPAGATFALYKPTVG